MTDHARGRDPRVLVLDGNSQASLSVARSLNERGVAVDVSSVRHGSIGERSRHVESAFVYPDPAVEPEAFVDALVDRLSDTEYDAVIPTRDDTTMVVAKYKDRLAATGTTVGVEDWERFRLVADKAKTFEIAADLSVPTPTTLAPKSVAEVEAVTDEFSYPVVVKSRSKTSGQTTTGWTRSSSATITTPTPRGARRHVPPAVGGERLLSTDAAAHPGVRPGQTTTTVGVADDGPSSRTSKSVGSGRRRPRAGVRRLFEDSVTSGS